MVLGLVLQITYGVPRFASRKARLFTRTGMLRGPPGLPYHFKSKPCLARSGRQRAGDEERDGGEQEGGGGSAA
jgi:hypothetical protein